MRNFSALFYPFVPSERSSVDLTLDEIVEGFAECFFTRRQVADTLWKKIATPGAY